MHFCRLTRPRFALLLAAATIGTAAAQNSCPKRTEPITPGERALAERDLPRAEALLTSESKAPGIEGDRAHDALIRTLLREDKIDEAQRNAESWLASAPQDSWAKTAAGEVQWRKGQINEALQSFNAAGTMDGCNPRVHADIGKFKQFSGQNASAKVQFDYAHTLDPVDPEIASRWSALQPRSARLQHIEATLAHPDSLSDEQRKSLENAKQRLSAPAAPRSCSLTNSATSTSIPFRRIQDGPERPVFWGLEVYFNGKMRRLEIDTGAHGLLLSRAAAAGLDLPTVGSEKLGGVGDEGPASAHVARVQSIKIGALEFSDCNVEVLDQDSKVLEAPDGLIGGDVLADFLLTLDYPGHTVKLDPLPPLPDADQSAGSPALNTAMSENQDRPIHDAYVAPGMADWTHVLRSGHDLILPVRLNNGPIRLFIVDTGARLDSISPEVAQEVAHVSKMSDVDIVGIAGKVRKTYSTGPVTLSFARISYPSQGMVAMENSGISRGIGVEIAGFIGAETLRVLTMQVDYRDDLIHFIYDPKRVTRCVGQKLGDCY